MTFGEGEMAVHALADIDLSVAAGDVVGLKGSSSSGKSTLLNVVACILEPTAGCLLLGDKTVWDGRCRITDLRRLRRERIGFIFQFHNLLPFLNAIDNVALAMTVAGVAAAAACAPGTGIAGLPAAGQTRHRHAITVNRRRGQARGYCPRGGQPPAHHPGRRADGGAGFRAVRVVMDPLRQVAHDQGAAILVVTHEEKIIDRLERMVSLRNRRIQTGTQHSRPVTAPRA